MSYDFDSKEMWKYYDPDGDDIRNEMMKLLGQQQEIKTTITNVESEQTSQGQRITQNETSITQNANNITLQATSISDLEGRMTSAESSITVNADEIDLRAKQTDLNALDGRVGTAESNITQNADQIALKVSQTTYNTDITAAGTGLKDRMTSAESSITQNANNIELKVSESDFNGNNIVSKINLSSTTVDIQGSKINLVGAVTVLSDITGNLGTITAGTINGITINGGTIQSNTTINVGTDLTVGNNIYLGTQSATSYKYLRFHNNSYVYANDSTMLLVANTVQIGSASGAYISRGSTYVAVTGGTLTCNNGLDVAGGSFTTNGAVDAGTGNSTYAYFRHGYNTNTYMRIGTNGWYFYMNGSLKQSFSSIPKSRLDLDDGRQFGVNSATAMQPILMDRIKVNANGRTKVALDEEFASFVGEYDVLTPNGVTVSEKYVDHFYVDGIGSFTLLVHGVEKGKEDVCGYAIEDETVEMKKSKNEKPEKTFKERGRKYGTN